MPIRKVDYEEAKEKKVSDEREMKINLRYIIIFIIVIYFGFQISSAIVSINQLEEKQKEEWLSCLVTYSGGLCRPRARKENLKEDEACNSSLKCLEKGFKLSMMDFAFNVL